MVMGDNSLLRGCGFESQCCILDGHDIFTLICCKNCIVCLKRPKINKKGAGVGPFFEKKYQLARASTSTKSGAELSSEHLSYKKALIKFLGTADKAIFKHCHVKKLLQNPNFCQVF